MNYCKLFLSKKEEFLQILKRKVEECRRCSLSLSRKKVVFGEGNLNAELMFIGEAPGLEEDLSGRPFVGRSGQLLTRMIQAMNLRREEVYIANILKCRPPRNRDPLPYEVENCLPYLFIQIDIIRPKLLVLLGRVAGLALLGEDFSLSKCRGKFFKFRGRKTIASFHPAYLLMHPSAKKLAWEDMKKVMRELSIPLSKE